MKLKKFTQSQAKVNYIYELTPHGIRAKAALMIQFLDSKRIEYNDLKEEIKILENELNLFEDDQSDKNRRSS